MYNVDVKEQMLHLQWLSDHQEKQIRHSNT